MGIFYLLFYEAVTNAFEKYQEQFFMASVLRRALAVLRVGSQSLHHW
jgi:hypothetical protein